MQSMLSKQHELFLKFWSETGSFDITRQCLAQISGKCFSRTMIDLFWIFLTN